MDRAVALLSFLTLAVTSCRPAGDDLSKASCAGKGVYEACRIEEDGSVNVGCLPVNTITDWSTFRRSRDVSRVRTSDDWYACVAMPSCNPLAGEDPSLVAAFTEALRFDARGLASIDLGGIADRISVARLEAVLEVFGLGRKMVSIGRCPDDADRLCLAS